MLLVMQTVVTACAYPILPKAVPASSFLTTIPQDLHAAASKICDEHLDIISKSKVCFQYYVGNLSAGAVDLSFATPSPAVSTVKVATVQPYSAWGMTVPSVLLQHATFPATSIRFQVLRI